MLIQIIFNLPKPDYTPELDKINLNWIAGLIIGEGGFNIRIINIKESA